MGGGHGKHPLPCQVCWQQPEGEQRRLSVPVGGGSVSGVPGRRARHGRDPGSSCRSIHRIRLLGFHCLLCPPGSDPARGAGNDASGTQVESEPRCLPACEDLPSGGRGAELTNGHVTLALQRVGRGFRRVAVGLWRREDPASTPRRRRGAPGCGVTVSQRSGPRVGRRPAMVMISRQRWHRSASGLRAPRRGRAPAPGLSHSGRRTFLGAGAEVTGSCQAFASL